MGPKRTGFRRAGKAEKVMSLGMWIAVGIVGSAVALAVIIALFRSGKPIRGLVGTGAQGICALGGRQRGGRVHRRVPGAESPVGAELRGAGHPRRGDAAVFKADIQRITKKRRSRFGSSAFFLMPGPFRPISAGWRFPCPPVASPRPRSEWPAGCGRAGWDRPENFPG